MSLVPYDNRDGHIWFDGEMLPWRAARVHVLTHGLHYGSGVFEGIRCYGGKSFKLREHADRMVEGCKFMDMDLTFTSDDIVRACEEVIASNNITDGYLRPLAWRGSEQMGVASQLSKIHLAVAAWAWPSYFPAEMRENGIKVMTSKWRRPPPETAPTHVKAAGLYMICTLSKHEADAAGCQDALMLDYRGQVAELCSANLFFVKDGALHTPKPDCFLDGITRRTVIDLAHAEGIDVIERVIMPDELSGMDECFATGTAAEVTAIGRIDAHTYKVGPVTRLLRDKYEQLVRA